MKISMIYTSQAGNTEAAVEYIMDGILDSAGVFCADDGRPA